MRALLVEVELLVEPLEEAAQSLPALTSVLEQLGWRLDAQQSDWPPIRASLAFASRVDEFLDAFRAVAEATDDKEIVQAMQGVLEILAPLMAELGSMANGGSQVSLSPFDKPVFWENLAEDLFGYLVHTYFEQYHPGIGGMFEFLGIVTATPAQNDVPFIQYQVSFDRIPRVFYDVPGLLAERYHWGGDGGEDFDALGFIGGLGRMLRGFGARVSFGLAPPALVEAYYTPDSPYCDSVPALSATIYQYLIGDVGIGGIWICVAPIPPLGAGGQLPSAEAPHGVVVYPIVTGAADITFPLTDAVEASVAGQFASEGAVRLQLRPSGLSVSFGEDLGLSIDASAGLAFGEESPTVLLGSAIASRLEFLALEAEVGVSGPILNPAPEGRLDLTGGQLVIAPGEGDSFLQRLLPPDGIQASFDFGVDWSQAEGLRFRGGAALEVTLPIHQSFLNVIELESIFLSLGFNDQGVPIKVGVTGNATLGPVHVSVQRVGVAAKLSFPESGGNLGKADIELDFLPPTGAGLAITGAVTGGGFLEFDTDNERYAGILALECMGISITAIGLITTKMPDGSKGFSMLVNIGITFSPPVQLSMGMTLSGVGGLIAINRSMVIDVLREGIQKGTLDSILFPDPAWVIPNAAKVISDLRSVFTPIEGRFIIGPMAQIGYGTPNFVIGELGVFIELPDPPRIVLLGQIFMSLPKPEAQIVGVSIDIVGVLDFQKQELSFQASINASSLLVFELFGDCAFFLRWGNQPDIAFAIGGFHPKFPTPAPPSVFSGLRRLGANINYGPAIQLGFGGYLAVTPNSLQLGARVEVFIGIKSLDLGIVGFVSFDGLIYFSPFSFDIAIEGGMSVSVGSVSLANLRVAFNLSGPTPWNVRGCAVIKILFIDINVAFNVTWGRSDKAELLATDPWPELEWALRRAESWGSKLPVASSMVETLASLDETDTTSESAAYESEVPHKPVIVHPAGTLEIRQNVTPLELKLQKFANAPVAVHDCFRIAKLSTGQFDLNVDSVDEFFARGQFQELSNAQKLSVPSFEKLPGGVVTKRSGHLAIQGKVHSEPVGYESIVIKANRISQKPRAEDRVFARAEWAQMRFLSRGNASRRNAPSGQGRTRFARSGERLVGTVEDQYVVAIAETLACRIDIGEQRMTRSQAEEALERYLVDHPGEHGTLVVVSEFELDQEVA